MLVKGQSLFLRIISFVSSMWLDLWAKMWKLAQLSHTSHRFSYFIKVKSQPSMDDFTVKECNLSTSSVQHYHQLHHLDVFISSSLSNNDGFLITSFVIVSKTVFMKIKKCMKKKETKKKKFKFTLRYNLKWETEWWL